MLLLLAAHMLQGQVIREAFGMFPREVKQVLLQADRSKHVRMDVNWFDNNYRHLDRLKERARYRFMNDSVVRQRFFKNNLPVATYYGVIRGKEILEYDWEKQQVIKYNPQPVRDSAGFTICNFVRPVPGDTVFSCVRTSKDASGRVTVVLTDEYSRKKPVVQKTLARYDYSGDSALTVSVYDKQGANWKLLSTNLMKHAVVEKGQEDAEIDLSVLTIYNPDGSGARTDSSVVMTQFKFDAAGRVKRVDKRELNDILYNKPSFRSILHVYYPPVLFWRAGKKVEKKP